MKPSTVVELAGLALLATAAYILAGLGVLCIVLGIECVLASLALDGIRIHINVEHEPLTNNDRGQMRLIRNAAGQMVRVASDNGG